MSIPLMSPGAVEPRGIGRIPFRWWIAALLFASTTINYIDRQTLSVLAPHLKEQYTWSNTDFALVVISFRAAYSIFQVVSGRLLDRLGTRRGLPLSVLWYSCVAMATSAAAGPRSFAAFRFLRGAGEAANWPGATKAVSEWFPKSERGVAVAMFDSGSAVGGAIAPAMVVWLYSSFGSWRPAFIITGLLGMGRLILWRNVYHPPETHHAITEKEWPFIFAIRADELQQHGEEPWTCSL